MSRNININKNHVYTNNDLVAGDFTKLIQVRRTSTFTLSTTFTDITFDTTDFSTDTSVIEHDSTNTERINVLSGGTFFIHYCIPVGASTINFEGEFNESQIFVNGTTLLPGSFLRGGTSTNILGGGTIVTNSMCRTIIGTLSAGDYITLQTRQRVATTSTLDDVILIIYRLGGGKGTTGADGDLMNQGTWANNVTYFENDIVRNRGATYIATSSSFNSEPIITPGSWNILSNIGAIPIDWQNSWISQDYTGNQAVFFEGSSYINILDTTSSQDPTNATYWNIMTLKGASGTTNNNNQKFFDAYHTVAQTLTVEPTYTSITLGAQRTIDSTAYAHILGGSGITILETGTYLVYARLSTDISVGVARSISRMKLQLNAAGAGFADIAGTTASMYNRFITIGEDSCSNMLVLDLSAGDAIRMQGARHSGTDTIVTRTEACGIVIARLDAFDIPTDTQSTFFDDFMGANIDDKWTQSTTGGASTIGITTGVGGLAEITSGTTATDNAELSLSGFNTIRVSDTPTLIFRANLSSITQSLTNIGIFIDSSNLIDFQYNAAGAGVNWFARTMSGGATTSTDTGIAGDTSFHKFEIIAVSSSRIIFKIDNAIVATNTTNIPVGLQHIRMRQESNSAAARTLTVDYVNLTHTRA